jgi:hypothetical protein
VTTAQQKSLEPTPNWRRGHHQQAVDACGNIARNIDD